MPAVVRVALGLAARSGRAGGVAVARPRGGFGLGRVVGPRDRDVPVGVARARQFEDWRGVGFCVGR
eukprot:7400917-Lingulodinium_polyedra.AAC.1